eukprot:TRINITY_DN55404_c0_g1_i1.p1 TRINITY_DN55404_c0_g1~~TRINITY_DN55404_c0_g1_i1.p1  ORF type:complete len:151 (+),score=2.36 TRINITY_DN55404_c0_g1_i1:165-617(+)
MVDDFYCGSPGWPSHSSYVSCQRCPALITEEIAYYLVQIFPTMKRLVVRFPIAGRDRHDEPYPTSHVTTLMRALMEKLRTKCGHTLELHFCALWWWEYDFYNLDSIEILCSERVESLLEAHGDDPPDRSRNNISDSGSIDHLLLTNDCRH